MSVPRTQRLRDPVHGLIVFRDTEPLDQLAWKLLDTPEFQRLRRIKQLGVSEFVFPSATHTRFAHSVGVFHTARNLVRIIERELPAINQRPDSKRAEVATIAALLHDLGHGPFSHTFEGVQKSREIAKRHERWTAEIIRDPNGSIRPLVDAHWPEGGFCDAVAELLEAEDPIDIYHAVVSSAFDADQLDYLRRDRLMTGTGAGAIDFDWLMEQVRVRQIKIEAADADGEEDQALVSTFCLDPKAFPAAEQFLLARYTLHEQVYFHKTTRCIEQMIAKLLCRVAHLAEKPNTMDQIRLDASHPLVRFFAPEGATLQNYLALDDVMVTDAIRQLRAAPDEKLAQLAQRLLNRDLYKTLDLASFGHDEGVQRKEARRIDRRFGNKITAKEIIKDESASVSIYTQIGGDDERARISVCTYSTRKKARSRSPRCRLSFELCANQGSSRGTTSSVTRIAMRHGKREESAMKEREHVVAAVLAAAGGQMTGRVRLQKAVYLMDRLGFDSGFLFDYHHYGPFSRDLDNATADAKAFGLVEERLDRRQSDGATYSVFTLKGEEEPDAFGSLGRDKAGELARLFVETNVTVLELAATVDWLSRVEKYPDWRNEITKRKGVKVRGGRLEKALALLDKLSLSPPSAPASS